MNADFEAELSHTAGAHRRTSSSAYHRTSFFDALNRRLAPNLLWLARPGDALLLQRPWSDELRREAARRGVELVEPVSAVSQSTRRTLQSIHAPAQSASATAQSTRATVESTRLFTPWGWTPSAVSEGERAGSVVRPLPFDIVARVNSKLWSHALEVELGLALHGATTADTFEELSEAVARAAPRPSDKWVVKSPFGFAARERVLGRGPHLAEPQAKWARRRLAAGETLIFQLWLEVLREYGVVLEIEPDGACRMLGFSDLRTNGAGTGRGYMLGRPPGALRAAELERVARIVCERLFREGYHGPVGVDALEHAGGLHPLLEVNARYTMGFVALAVERSLKPNAPTFWSTNTTSPTLL